MSRGRTSLQGEVRIPIIPTLEHYGADGVPDAGRWTAMKCPFHGDNHASASVNTDLQLFVCHSCEMKGNASQLIMKEENRGKEEGEEGWVDLQAAIESAAAYAGQSAEPVLRQSRTRSRVPGGSGDIVRSRRYRGVGRGNGRSRGSREDGG